MVGCGRLIIFVVSGSFCSLQLGSGGAALLPAVQKLANILSKVSETGTAPGGDSWTGKWNHRFGVIRNELTGLLMIIPVLPGQVQKE